MATIDEVRLSEEIWNNAVSLAEAAADLDEEITAKYGYPATDYRAKTAEHREMSTRYFAMMDRVYKMQDGSRALIFNHAEAE